MLAPGRLRPAP